MYAVVRIYSGPGAKALIERIVSRRSEVEDLIRGVAGFVNYTLIETEDGGMTVTVCKTSAGTDESVRVAREWVSKNAADLGASPPRVYQGPANIHIT